MAPMTACPACPEAAEAARREHVEGLAPFTPSLSRGGRRGGPKGAKSKGRAPYLPDDSGCWGQGFHLSASWTSSQFLWVAPMS